MLSFSPFSFLPLFFPSVPLLPHSTFGPKFICLPLSNFLSSSCLFISSHPVSSLSRYLSFYLLLVFLLLIPHLSSCDFVDDHFRSCCNNICSLFPCFLFLPVVLPPTERALLPRAQSPVLRCRDRQRTGLPPLPQHRLQRLEAREHPAGLTGTHHSYRFRPLQGEHRAQRDHVDLLRYTRGKDKISVDSELPCFNVLTALCNIQ